MENKFPSTWLFLDASGLVTRVGLWEAGRWRAYHEDAAPALEALFATTRTVLDEAKADFSQMAGYFYVEGPGSVLGLRLAAMAIRTWQAGHPRPVRSCGSLHLAAALALATGIRPPFALCTEARQGVWHLLNIADAAAASHLAAAQPLTVADADLPGGQLFHLPARKAWASPPPHAERLPAALRNHPDVLTLPRLCRETATATPFGAAAVYRKWEGSPVAS